MHASDIKIGAKLKLLTDPEAIVVAVAEPRVEVEPEEDEALEAEEGAEPEVISEKKADDEDSE